jgi:hypothetical protein
MPRVSSASLAFFVSSLASLALPACGEDATPNSSSNGGSTSGATSGGSSGASAGAQSSGGAGAASGGAAGQAGSASVSGQSGTGTAGAAGSAGQGGGGAGGGSAACGTALFCDDFESYTAAPGAPWAVSKNEHGAVVIDGAQHQSGSKAVKFTLTGSETYRRAFINLEQPFPVAGNAYYGRMMIYITTAPNDGVHWTMISGEGPLTTPLTADVMVRYGGQHQKRFMANYETADPVDTDCWKHSQTAMPEGKWACMEWYFEGATNTQKLWLDKTPIADMTVTGQGEGCVGQGTSNNWYFPTFERLAIGWESYQTDGDREVWIDDVVISTMPIGCPE